MIDGTVENSEGMVYSGKLFTKFAVDGRSDPILLTT